jgi:hypothetical protein
MRLPSGGGRNGRHVGRAGPFVTGQGGKGKLVKEFFQFPEGEVRKVCGGNKRRDGGVKSVFINNI